MSRANDADRSYGGQAVIEGVMFRGTSDITVAVRVPNGEIVVERRPIRLWTARQKWRNIPLLRGVAALIESLVLGTWALMYSADKFAGEDEQLGPAGVAASMALAIVLAVGLFMLLPTYLAGLIRAAAAIQTPVLLNLGEGLLRLTILVGYIALVSRIRDVGRVFEYHGAEHKVINAYEQGRLESECIADQSTLHPRCGTSFLLFVVVISALLFSLFGWPSWLVRTALRLSLLPLVAAISYEIIRFAGRSKSPLVRILVWPGMMLQRLTTRQPDQQQVEVAVAAFEALREAERGWVGQDVGTTK